MLVRYRERTPFDVRSLERDIDRIFNGAFGSALGFAWPTRGNGAVEVTPDADGVTVRAELPGVDPAKISIGVDNRVLTIRAEREDAKRENGRYRLRERAHGTFSYSVRLGADLDVDAVSADSRHGVLTVRIPKRAAAKPRQIEIQTS